jgi:DNA topoisomerase-1
VDKEFEPTYEISPGKQKVITVLRKAALNADKIYLATDPDREGEAIAWHVKSVLESSKKGTKKQYFRATFHEITKAAVLSAVQNPSEIRMDLVDAQQARRVVDRLVGYKVSPVLWKKIRRGLSAGRVQSVAVKLIVEREREILSFIPEEYWEVDVALSIDPQAKPIKIFSDEKTDQLPEKIFIARVSELNQKKYLPTKQSDVTELQEILPTAKFQVVKVEKKQRNRSSLPPFTTSTLQQKGATSLGYSGKRTMQLAQQLYEEGLITYHRTDSLNLSTSSIEMARGYIVKSFGKQYLPETPRFFANKSKNAQEAHEAIRVTDVMISPESILQKSARFSAQHVRLYDLIWRRFLASQMQAAVYDQTTVTTSFKPTKKSSIESGEAKTNGSIISFDGWMKLFPSGDDTLLPNIVENEPVGYADHLTSQKFTQPPPRYNDASLIKTLEQKGIGRPSTYASIISVIEERGYVEKTDKKFFATAVGMTVTDFLVEHIGSFMDYEFTAEMEEDLDRIARGEKKWRKVVADFFGPFAKKIAKVEEHAERKQIPVESTGISCPECGEKDGGEVVIRTGKFGKFKSCNRFPDCKYAENLVHTVDGVLCPLCQQGNVVIKQTRWGKSFFACNRYPECAWASWKQPEPGETMTQAEWEVLQAAREERKQKRQALFAKKDTPAKAAKPKKSTKKKPAKKAATKSTKKSTKASKAKK